MFGVIQECRPATSAPMSTSWLTVHHSKMFVWCLLKFVGTANILGDVIIICGTVISVQNLPMLYHLTYIASGIHAYNLLPSCQAMLTSSLGSILITAVFTMSESLVTLMTCVLTLETSLHTNYNTCVICLVVGLCLFCSFMEKDKLREVARPDFRPSNQVHAECKASLTTFTSHLVALLIIFLQLHRTFSDAVFSHLGFLKQNLWWKRSTFSKYWLQTF